MATLTCEDARVALPGASLPDALTFSSDAGRLGLLGNWTFLTRLLLGEARLLGGRVELAGTSASEALRLGTAGIAPKEVPLPPEWNVETYLRRASELSGEPSRSAKRLAARILETLGMTPLASRRLRDIELPERRALSIAQALIGSPPVIVVERPLDDLHDGAAEWIVSILDRAAAERRLVVCAGSALPLGESDRFLRTLDEIALVSRGAVVKRGAPLDVLAPGERYLVTIAGAPEPLIEALDAVGITAEKAASSSEATARYRRLVVELPTGTDTSPVLDAAVSIDACIVEMAPLFGAESPSPFRKRVP